MMTPTLIHDPDLLARIAVMETAVYDPPKLWHAYESSQMVFFVRGQVIAFCQYCRKDILHKNFKQPCPARPASDPDWPCCLLLADIHEEHGDLVTAAWWRWLEREKKVPTEYSKHRMGPDKITYPWDWWAGEGPSGLTDLYHKLDNSGRYPTRRAAYDDLKRVWTEQHAATDGS